MSVPKWQAENVISIQYWKYFLCTEKENNGKDNVMKKQTKYG
jgi:hypothetical protein